MPDPYSRNELITLERLVGSGEIACPVCGAELAKRSVPPRADVSYVRDRVWLTCSECDRHGVVDRPKSLRPPTNDV